MTRESGSERFDLLVERLNNVEPTHIRHHQVENDQVRPLRTGEVDRLLTAMGSQDGARQAHHWQADQGRLLIFGS